MKSLITFFLIMLATLFASGQPLDNRTADEVVRDYNEYSKKQDWSGLTALLHPDSLKEFRSMFTIMVEKTPDAATLIRMKSIKEIDLLSDAQIFERLFSTIYKMVPGTEEAVKNMEVVVIGSVEEMADLRHYVYRTTFKIGSSPISKVDVYTLKRFQNSWKVIMSDDEIRAMGSAFSAQEPPVAAPRKALTRKKKKR